MSKDPNLRAALLLGEAWRTHHPLPPLPEDCRPRDADTAYAIQKLVAQGIGSPRAWKIGALSPAKPLIFGPVYQVLNSPARLPGSRHRVFGIEGEVAVRLNRDLPKHEKPYTASEMSDTIDSYYPAVEVVESRFADVKGVDVFALIADLGVSGAIILGAPKPRPEFDLAKAPAEILVDSKVVARTTESGNVGGDPYQLLAACANHVAHYGDGLRRGDIVTTGSTTGIIFAHPRAVVVADFGAFGKVELLFSD
jgi:2-keto-4-pentenoate hydratase